MPLGLQFQCRLDQLVNFLAEVRTGPIILAVPRLILQSGGGPDKQLSVSVTLAGVIRSPEGPTTAAP